MGSFNSKYFGTKSGSLEESIRKAVGEKLVGGQKKLDKDKDGDIDGKDFAMLRKDAKKKKDESVDEGKMKQMASLIDDIANAMKKDKMMKSFADKFVKDAQKTLDPRKSLEKVLPDYVPGKDIAKLLNMGENYDIGTPENTMAKLDATPGQSQDDWQQQVDVMQKKNASMREALAKVWGMEEGKNPFKTEGGHLPSEKKKKEEDKTMTGKPVTKVEIDPDMKEVKIGKKNVR